MSLFLGMLPSPKRGFPDLLIASYPAMKRGGRGGFLPAREL
jgi:hypothetical protein